MSDKVVIQIEQAPRPIGPYSQAIKAGGFMFLSGMLGLDPATGRFAGADIESQTRQAMKNIETLIECSGLTMGHIVRCNLYVTNLQDMPLINKIYSGHFIYQPPARTTVQVAALPGGALIEIEATAMLPAEKPSAGVGLRG